AQVCRKPEVAARYLPQPRRQPWLRQRLALFRLLYQQQRVARELLP
nr:hypothetical protein [Pluralibacter gergoviae]